MRLYAALSDLVRVYQFRDRDRICCHDISVTQQDAILREAFRVLKPGGRFAVSDVVMRGEVPGEVRRSLELWIGCIAGALQD
jgi:SAM-dependent methyltransferase